MVRPKRGRKYKYHETAQTSATYTTTAVSPVVIPDEIPCPSNLRNVLEKKTRQTDLRHILRRRSHSFDLRQVLGHSSKMMFTGGADEDKAIISRDTDQEDSDTVLDIDQDDADTVLDIDQEDADTVLDIYQEDADTVLDMGQASTSMRTELEPIHSDPILKSCPVDSDIITVINQEDSETKPGIHFVDSDMSKSDNIHSDTEHKIYQAASYTRPAAYQTYSDTQRGTNQAESDFAISPINNSENPEIDFENVMKSRSSRHATRLCTISPGEHHEEGQSKKSKRPNTRELITYEDISSQDEPDDMDSSHEGSSYTNIPKSKTDNKLGPNSDTMGGRCGNSNTTDHVLAYSDYTKSRPQRKTQQHNSHTACGRYQKMFTRKHNNPADMKRTDSLSSRPTPVSQRDRHRPVPGQYKNSRRNSRSKSRYQKAYSSRDRFSANSTFASRCSNAKIRHRDDFCSSDKSIGHSSWSNKASARSPIPENRHQEAHHSRDTPEADHSVNTTRCSSRESRQGDGCSRDKSDDGHSNCSNDHSQNGSPFSGDSRASRGESRYQKAYKSRDRSSSNSSFSARCSSAKSRYRGDYYSSYKPTEHSIWSNKASNRSPIHERRHQEAYHSRDTLKAGHSVNTTRCSSRENRQRDGYSRDKSNDGHSNWSNDHQQNRSPRKREYPATASHCRASDPKRKKYRQHCKDLKDNDWIIAEIYNSDHLEPEELCLMLVTHLEKITQFLSSNCPIEDIPLFFRVVNKGMSSSLTHSHRCKVLYTLREQKLFERQDLQEELKRFYTKETLSMSDIEFIADITDLMKLSVDLAALPLRDSLICTVMLEQVLNKLGDGMQHLKDKLTEVKEIQNQMRQSNKDSAHDGDIARFMRESEMYILPSVDIIRSKSNKELTEPHKIGTPFDSELHYLLYTFSIFREDFIRPLCNGIKRYMSFVDEESDHYFRDTDVRLFEDVHIQSKKFIKGTGIVWEIHLGNMHYHPSILKFGSFLCFSHDGFSTLFYATVAHRDAQSLKQGKIDVQFIDIDTQEVLPLMEYTFVMLESRSFYPAYSHSLKTLKDMYTKIESKCLSLPLKPYMIGHSMETRVPKYLEMEDTVDFKCLLQYGSASTAKKYDSVCITDLKQWPISDELGLDESQYEALQMALTKDVALIQGPPGTGKTFMGIRLAEFLLSNRHLWRKSDRYLSRPLLLISYTNHALDQFLGALMETPALQGVPPCCIVRVGSRCENETLEQYNIKVHRRESFKFRDHRRTVNVHIESYDFNNRMIKQYYNGLVHEDTLRTVMSYRHYERLTNRWIPMGPDNGTRLLDWLDVKVSQSTGNIAKGMTHDIFWTEEDLFEEDKERLLDISDDMENDEDQNDIPKMAFNRITLASEKYWQNVPSNERLKLLISVVNTVNTNDRMSSDEAHSVNNIWQLNVPQRWRLYRHWIWNATSKYRTAVSEAESRLEESCQLDKEVRTALDVQIMRKAHVVAMTTTGAAQHSSVLQIVAPAVVIVEEAAQVAEPHVIGALSQSCQHLIMIGDHQQLQPSYNDFQLCRKYKTDVSLFERWIRSGMEYKQLQLQHRMRPEISSLLKPHIYKTLDDHDSVFEYNNIRGMTTNLFFLDHDHLEDHSEGSLSHRNQHEAKMITKLYRHLILQCYSPDDITILTPYKDQVYLLKGIIEELEKHDPVLQRAFPSEERKKVRITAVDNYQGEENKIILISLVRSNMNKNIGYLSRANRICVILSRAREGLYVIGNMNMLKEQSTLWGKVLVKAEETQNIGNILKLKCEKHKVEIAVEKPEDFAKIADGGCDQPCETRLECGHACSRKCHISDKSHKLPCKKQCSKVCPRGHPCQKECHEKCGDCKEKVMVELESCGHTQEILCYRDPHSEQCKERCTKKLECGHVCQRKCGERCNTPSNCMELVKIDARCGHNIQIACCTQSNPDCRVPCQGILKCGHKCKGKCGKCFRGNLHQECTANCTRVLICGHACRKRCSVPCGPCTQKCENKCLHSKCKNQCGDVCNMCVELCCWRCKRGCPNKFECKRKCGEPCDRSACNHPCKKKLPCKHRCAGFYCEPCFCLECQDDNPREIFFGAEDEPDSIFYQLPDCKHIFESFGLDTYMKQTSDDDSIRRKECPKCKSPVLNAERYNNVIKSAQKDIEKVKKRFLSSKDALREKKKKIQTFINIPKPCQITLETSKTVQAMDRVLMFLQNRDTFVDNVMSMMNEISQEGERYIDADQVHHLMNELLNLDKWLNHRHTFSEQQVDECQMEITRIRLWWKICRIKGHVSQKHDKAFLDDKDKIEAMALDLGKTKLSQDEVDKVSKFIAEAEQKFQMCGLSKDEKIMIVKAMDYSKQGHWYKCKNGHIYTIGECGGAMETSNCPECGEVIGGQNHRLADGNDVAGEMDGATHGAWSEQANMENYNFYNII